MYRTMRDGVDSLMWMVPRYERGMFVTFVELKAYLEERMLRVGGPEAEQQEMYRD